MGVWMHNNNANGGYAILVNTDVEWIGGTHDNTTALCWTYGLGYFFTPLGARGTEPRAVR
jgi:hypothetical protein